MRGPGVRQRNEMHVKCVGEEEKQQAARGQNWLRPRRGTCDCADLALLSVSPVLSHGRSNWNTPISSTVSQFKKRNVGEGERTEQKSATPRISISRSQAGFGGSAAQLVSMDSVPEVLYERTDMDINRPLRRLD